MGGAAIKLPLAGRPWSTRAPAPPTQESIRRAISLGVHARVIMAGETDKSRKEIEEKYEAEKKKILPVFLLQFIMAVLFNVCVLGGGYYFFPPILPVPNSNDFSVKLLYTLRVYAFPQALLLSFVIIRVARKRGDTPAGNPLSGQDVHYLQAEKNALTNTVEQVLCSSLFVLVLITYLEPSEMKIIPLLSFSFIVGRLLFIIGYSIDPLYRVAGIIMNFNSLGFFIVCIFYLIYRRGLMHNIQFSATGDGDHSSYDKEL